jgi:aminoglycoside phosphotransferase (APT) family kinase protein
MSPRHARWEAFAESVTPGARVARMHRLVGGGSADAYDVTLDRAPGRVIVKVFRDGDDTAPLEWSHLKFAQRLTMPVPEPIAADLESTWFGRPAIVMSRLTGRPDVAPKDVDSWIGSLARALTELHETALDGAEGALTRPPRAETWRPPAGQHDSLISRAVSAVTAHLPSLTSEHVFTHGDFNPSNILWYRGRISGVVDWSAARLDARWSELAYCRGAVCLLLGPDVADRLADAYSDIVGHASDELAVYDLMSVSSRHYLAESLEADRHLGPVPDYEVSLAHLDEQLRRSLKRLDW